MELTYLGIDPGKTNGVAWVTVDTDKKQVVKDKMIQMSQNELDDFMSLLVEGKTEMTIVMEDFHLWSWKAQQQAGSDMPASQVIGVVRSYVRRSKGRLKLVEQSSQNNGVRAQHSGRKIPKNHDVSHKVVAYNHVFGYLLENNIIKSRMFWK